MSSSIPQAQEQHQLEWIDMISMEFGDSNNEHNLPSQSSRVIIPRDETKRISSNKLDNSRLSLNQGVPISHRQQEQQVDISNESKHQRNNNNKVNHQQQDRRKLRSSIASSNKLDGCRNKNNERRVTIMKPISSGVGSNNKCRTCLILICILQACLILGILGLSYYFRWPLIINLNSAADDKASSSGIRSTTINNLNNNNNQDRFNIYRVYTNGQNTSKLLLDLARACNQREHDRPYAIACKSSQLNKCKRVEPLSNHQPIDDAGSMTRKLTIITSSKSGRRHEVKMVPIKWVNNCPANDQPNCHFKTRLSVYLNEPLQDIIGWGGALTDSSINNILSLSVNGTRSLMDDYFSRERGLGYNLVRITIGGSDLSGRFYTNDDIKPGSEDIKMEKFELREEDLLYKIPLLRLIQTDYEQPVKLFGSVWSPPVWMKTNNHFNKGQLRGAIGLKDQPGADRYFRALAEYKARFIDAYRRESIKFWALTVMNEPIFAKQPFLDFNTMIFPTHDYATYVATILGPRLRSDEHLRDIKLIVHDDNRKFLRSDTGPLVVNRSDVQKFIQGIATHGYVDEDFEAMAEIYDNYQGRFFILPDELCSGHLPFMDKALIGSWERGLHYAIDIIQSLRHRAAGWVDWNMALDLEGGPGWLGGRLDSPIIIDAARDTYYKSPMFYVIGHFSRYVPEGSVKISEKIINDKFDYRFLTATFLSPGKKQLVTVVLNENPYNVELIIEPLRSSGHIAPRQNAGFQVVLEPESITTILYPLPAEYTNPSIDVNQQ